MKGLPMDLPVDTGKRVAESYGIVFDFPEEPKTAYTQPGIEVSEYNEDGSWRLPISARYIIDSDRRIRYADVKADYTVRPDSSESIETLKKIG